MIKSFDLMRKELENQYLDIKFDPDSGLSAKELRDEFNRHRVENPDEPRILTRARLFYLICNKARISPDRNNCFADQVEHQNLLIKLRWEWQREESKKSSDNEQPSIPGSFESILDLSHTSPDWENLLKFGLIGLRDRAKAYSGTFYEAVVMVYNAAAILAKRLGEASDNQALYSLGERPPQTFQEALQLSSLYHELQEIEGEPVRSMGRFDLLYNEFYCNDIKSGRLTRDKAKEVLKFFWIKFYAQTQGKGFGKNFLFGPEVNELSYLGFEVYREMQTVDPKLSVRFDSDMPKKFMQQVVDCILAGSTGIVICNNSGHVETLIKNGKTPEDAANYIVIGCNEPAVMGKEMCCSGAAVLNLAKSVEITLEKEDFASFDDFLTAYFQTLNLQISLAIEQTKRHERTWPRINPSPFLSGSMDACVEKGLDASQAGAKYNNTGFIFAGLANVVDSLAVIEQLVYEKKLCSLAKLKNALAANWNNFEELRLTARNRVPKWGNNDDKVDRFAVKMTDFLGKIINNEPNARNGVFQAAIYSIIVTSEHFGKLTGALPDGRRAGVPLAMNTGAMVGMDKSGVTALINSVTKIDLTNFPSGTVLDIMLHPSVVSGSDGIDTIIAIIKTFFDQGGLAIQFNILDADILREAQREPEKYANLQVRVSGWNVRFSDLSPEEQEIFITKAETAS